MVHGEGVLPRSFTLDEHSLALRLGVPLRDLTAQPCSGFRNCCGCPACKSLERQIDAHRSAGRYPFDRDGKVKAPPAKRQPWQTAA